MIENAGLEEDSKTSDYPCIKEEGGARGEDEIGNELEEPMPAEEATGFRRLAARWNYLGQDRPDLQFAVNRLCRNMSAPRRRDEFRLKKMARYLLGTRSADCVFRDCEEDEVQCLDIFTDSDWAGCKATRKSTSGGIIAWGGNTLKSWSKSQSVVARSSGEAEYYALAKGLSEAIGMKSVLADLGYVVQLRLWTDSSAAKSIASRTGIGKVRHMDVTYLWVQQVVKERWIQFQKIKGTENPADVLTKPQRFADIDRLLNPVGIIFSRRDGGEGAVST